MDGQIPTAIPPQSAPQVITSPSAPVIVLPTPTPPIVETFNIKKLLFALFYATLVLLALHGLSFLVLKFLSPYPLSFIGYSLLYFIAYLLAGLSIGKIMKKNGWLYGGIWGLLAVAFTIGSLFISKSQSQSAGINSTTISYNLDFAHLFSPGLIVVIVLPILGGLLGSLWAKTKDNLTSESPKISALSVISFVVLLLLAIIGGYINLLNSFYTNLPTNFPSSNTTSRTPFSANQTGPGTFAAKVNNTVRKSDLYNFSQALKSYVDAHGSYPADITTTPQKISKDGLDLCKYLTESGPNRSYMITMPKDPSLLKAGQSSYQECASDYDTGYTIVKNPDGTVTLSAPLAELHEKISVTK